jgi:excisionase family DNA binding protein
MKKEVRLMEDFKLYSVEEIAGILKVTERTLYNYIKSGVLKAVKIGKYWRIKHTDLENFINKGTKI